MTASISDAPFLRDKALQDLLALLSRDSEEARVAGGAVRNALMGAHVADVDIATTCLPDETERRAAAAGFKPVPTGKAHGTITVVARGRAFEVTTLRADIDTDGRRAKVAFGRDWQADANRRDFTINALYATATGEVIDLVGGLADIEARNVRFIGDADQRIREDYLRILRFYRFFAWYGSGRPDAAGIRATARLKDGLSQLSAERVWSELRKLLAAPDPARALLWMRQAGVLTAVLPESEKWGIDAVPGLIGTERDLGWSADPLLRLAAIIPPTAERVSSLAERLKLAKKEAKRLEAWVGFGALDPQTSELAFAKRLYPDNAQAGLDRIRLALAGAREKAASSTEHFAEAAIYGRLLTAAENWQEPDFPVRASDLIAMGAEQGPALGQMMAALKARWIGSGFRASREELLREAGGPPAGRA